MADTKVSELTTATSVGGSDLLYLIQTNTSKKVTATTLFENLGNVVLRGNVSLDPAVQLLASPGIIDTAKSVTHLAVDSTGGILSIPRGKINQLKTIVLIASSGGTYTIASNIAGTANVVFNNVGDTATLLFTNNQWHVLATGQATAFTNSVNSVNGATGNVILSTSNVAESGNLYFTNERAYANTIQLGYLTLNSLTNFQGNIVPSADSVYDLGSPTNQWKSLYVSNSTIFVGGTPITVNASGELVVGSGEASANLATVSYVDAAVANAGGGAADTGDITFNGVKIIGAGTASGDGAGYSTIELVPDNSLYENDQYIVIDPTEGEPPHIHIRAGGTQDDSAAVLILGGERNNVRVNDGAGVRISNDDFNSEDYYFYDYNPDFISATWSDDEGNYFIDIRITDPSNPGPTNPDWNKFYNLLQYPENRVTVYDGNDNYELAILQTYTLGNPYDLRIKVNQAPPTNPSTLETIQFKIYTLTQNYLSLEEKYLDIEVKEDVSVYASAAIRFTTGTGSVQITTDDDNNSFSWRFTTDGELELPANGKITEGIVTDNPTIELTPADPEVESQKLVIKGGAGDDYHLHLTSGDLTETSLILGTDEHNVRTNVDGNIEINTYSYIDEETKNWLFDRLGNLTAPGDISLENGATVYKAERTDVIGAVPMGDISAVYDDDRGYEILVVKGNDELQLTTNGGDILKFGNAGLIFPDGTTQTTAWAGGRVVAVPSTSVGAEGDKAGDLAFSNEYFYYCTADYTNGQTNIWKRVAWSNDTWGE